MVVPDRVIRKLEGKPNTARFLFDYPIAFFGELVEFPKQAEIIRTWMEVQPKIMVITGWKRTTKTATAAYIGACWMLGKLDPAWPGARRMGIIKKHEWKKKITYDRVGLIGGKNLDHVDSVLLRQYRDMLPANDIKEWFSRQKHQISLHTGSRFVVRSYDQDLDSWKSGQYNLIHLDEEPPYDKLMECLERTRTTKGQIIISVAVDDADVSYLPEACQNPLKFFGTDSFLHFKLGVEDVPDEIYPEEEKKIVFKQYDGTIMESAVRKGEFAYTSGRWWPEFDVKTHVIRPFPIPDNWKKWRFMDAGMASPTACLWVALHPSNILFFYREYYKKGTRIEERCQDIIELSCNERYRSDGMWMERETNERFEMTLLDYHEFKRDPVTGDGLDFEYVKSGLQVQPSTQLDQEARRDILRKWMYCSMRENHFITHELGAPRVYVFDTCANLIWEAQKKTFKKSASERSSTPEIKIQNKDDHLMDCAEYSACELSWCIQDREIV